MVPKHTLLLWFKTYKYVCVSLQIQKTSLNKEFWVKQILQHGNWSNELVVSVEVPRGPHLFLFQINYLPSAVNTRSFICG